MKKLYLFLTFSFLFSALSAQSLVDKQYDSWSIDSLESILPNTKGKERMHLLNTLAETYWFHDPNMTLRYADEALVLSQQYEDKEA